MIYCKRETPDTRSNNKSKTNRQRHAKKKHHRKLKSEYHEPQQNT